MYNILEYKSTSLDNLMLDANLQESFVAFMFLFPIFNFIKIHLKKITPKLLDKFI